MIDHADSDSRIVIFGSTELPELVGLANRTIILYRGRVAGEVPGGAINGTALLHAINTGVVEQGSDAATPVMGGPQ